jgi:DNA-binding NarL/FixJ family response regulator
MRILVIDDQLNFEIALRGILMPHTVIGVPDPAKLRKVLDLEEPFDMAVVDLRFTGSASTGLTALARLRELSPATKTIITTPEEEENRLLYLLAAFQFFDPKALLAKLASDFDTRAIVEAVGRGEPAPNTDANPFRDAALMHPPLLHRVVRNQTDLRIWQELTRFDKRKEIANAANVHPSTVDSFTSAKREVIDTLNSRFQLRVAAAQPTSGDAHSTNLIHVIHFARIHLQFFGDTEVASLFEAHWRSR